MAVILVIMVYTTSVLFIINVSTLTYWQKHILSHRSKLYRLHTTTGKSHNFKMWFFPLNVAKFELNAAKTTKEKWLQHLKWKQILQLLWGHSHDTKWFNKKRSSYALSDFSNVLNKEYITAKTVLDTVVSGILLRLECQCRFPKLIQ